MVGGQLLWERLSVTLGATSNTIVTLDIASNIKNGTPGWTDALQIIPIPSTNGFSNWNNITVASVIESNGQLKITFNNSGSGASVTMMIWLPHSVHGNGNSAAFSSTPVAGVQGLAAVPNIKDLLWNRRYITLVTGANTVATGLTKGYDPDTDLDERTMVIIQPPTHLWSSRPITHGNVGAVTPGQVVITLAGASTSVMVLFWAPHTLIGPGAAVPYV